jgi:hypothetical protein
MAAAEASFRTSMFSISCGLMSAILLEGLSWLAVLPQQQQQ